MQSHAVCTGSQQEVGRSAARSVPAPVCGLVGCDRPCLRLAGGGGLFPPVSCINGFFLFLAPGGRLIWLLDIHLLHVHLLLHVLMLLHVLVQLVIFLTGCVLESVQGFRTVAWH